MHRTDNRQTYRQAHKYEHCEYVHNNNKYIYINSNLCIIELKKCTEWRVWSRIMHENESALFHFRQIKCVLLQENPTGTAAATKKS